MPGAGKLADLDDAVLAVVHYSHPQRLTFREVRNELKTRGFDVSVKDVKASVVQLRKLGYLSAKEEKERARTRRNRHQL
jgi:hypothetical protein